MFLNSALHAALDRIAERAADVRRAFTPGAVAQFDDVTTPNTSSDFTLDPLAVVAPDNAYFITADDQGRAMYTRDGGFALRNGQLVDAAGGSVRGFCKGGDALGALIVDPVDEALGRVRSPELAADGTLSYLRETVDPRTGARDRQRVVAGRIALARFPAGTRLTAADGGNRIAAPGTAPQIGRANDGGFGSLVPMHRERSRIDIDESLVRLRDAYRAFDALQAAEAAKAHLGKTAMDLVK